MIEIHSNTPSTPKEYVVQSLESVGTALKELLPTFDPKSVERTPSPWTGWITPRVKQMVEVSADARTSKKREVDREEMERRIERGFRLAAEEEFEDGMNSQFGESLVAAVREYGDDALLVIHSYVLSKGTDAEVAGEALRCLGNMDDKGTHGLRRWVLEEALTKSSSVIVRDGANLGLAYLDDEEAVPAIAKVIQNEKCSEFRELLEQTLRQLEGT